MFGNLLLVLCLASLPQPATQPAATPKSQLDSALAELQVAQNALMERVSKAPEYIEAKSRSDSAIAALEAARTNQVDASVRLELAKKKLEAQGGLSAVLRRFQDADPEFVKATEKVDAARLAIQTLEAQLREEKASQEKAAVAARKEKARQDKAGKEDPPFMDVHPKR